MARKLKPVSSGRAAGERAPDLRVAVDEAIRSMPWLEESDAAIVALARRLAQEIEETEDRAEELGALVAEFGSDRDMFKRLKLLEAKCDVTKIVGWLGPQLQGVLKDLAGNPQARKAMRADAPIGGRLAQLREAAGQDDA